MMLMGGKTMQTERRRERERGRPDQDQPGWEGGKGKMDTIHSSTLSLSQRGSKEAPIRVPHWQPHRFQNPQEPGRLGWRR